MSFGGRALPGSAGGAYSALAHPLAALRLLAPSALDPGAYGASPHAFGVRRQRVPVLLFSHPNTVVHYTDVAV